jgi:hypothetical protein
LISVRLFLACRLFEPDPAAFGSTSDIDGCEKFLMDMLTRVVERKVGKQSFP